LGEKLRAWGAASAVIAVGAFLTFGPTSLRQVMTSRYERDIERQIAKSFTDQPTPQADEAAGELPWQPFSVQFLERLARERKTVLVDFTADWCATCKVLEKFILNTNETRQLIDAHQIVTLQADWTDGSPEITSMLEALGSKQVPVVAIFPAGRPNEPIVFRGSYTKQALYDAIKGLDAPQTANATDQPAARPAEAVHASLISR
jgi:thiol:disulfide interchange protein